jgi:flavin reductase (DIM6/NTAB) family NADH-FMN oxidoreductase RutF/predicted ester cyclase
MSDRATALKQRLRDRLLPAWNDGDLAAIDDLMAPDYVRRGSGSEPQTREDLKATIVQLRTALPDLLFTLGDMVCEGDRIVSHWRFEGTHRGELFGVPPTGKFVAGEGLTSSEFRGDHVVTDWLTWGAEDVLGLLRIVPLAGESPAQRLRDARADNAAVQQLEPGIDGESLKAVHRKFATGVTIVTASLDGEPRGLVVNAFASVSLTPPLVLVAINRNAATHEFLFRNRSFAINILAADQEHLAARFSQPIADKFAGVPWSPGESGAPLLEGSAASLEVEIEERAWALTHTVFVGRVTGARVSARSPLVYLGGKFFDAAQMSNQVNGGAGS